MRLGFFQFDVAFGDKQANFQKVRQALTSCDFDLMVLPELFATGSIFTSKQQAWDFSEPVPDGETTQVLMAIAEAQNAYIVGGLVERDGDRLYNTAVIVGPQGLVGKHRKVYLPMFERSFFTPGTIFEVFEVLGVKVGFLLCYDSWFPEAGKTLGEQGVELIFNPSNFCGEDSLEVIQQRAQELSVYIITANRLGMDHDVGTDVTFIGASQILDPEGDVVYRAGCQESLVVRDISF